MNAPKAEERRRIISHQKSAAPETLPIVASADLFEGGREILIAHAGTYYRLKITRQGKLILNK